MRHCGRFLIDIRIKLSAAAEKIKARALERFKGWSCKDRIVVIESDDWGSIRSSDLNAVEFLRNQGYDVDKSCWILDTLESTDDLQRLYDVLSKFRDPSGRSAGLTANFVTGNPNFLQIRASKFEHYHVEPLWETCKKARESRGNLMDYWSRGFDAQVFVPQFHAREHIRWWEWLDALKANEAEATLTFELGMCGVPKAISRVDKSYFSPPYISHTSYGSEKKEELRTSIVEGISWFEKQFGYKSLSAIAPNCTWTDDSEAAWYESSVRYIQGGYCQRIETDKGELWKAHYLGERTKRMQLYLTRNCSFEPAKSPCSNAWEGTFSQIAHAFSRSKPAVISSHRVNYVGSINEGNRERGLMQLDKLISMIQMTWPDTYFLTTVELGFMIEMGLTRVKDLPADRSILYPQTNAH